jgi:hypothetical protein
VRVRLGGRGRLAIAEEGSDWRNHRLTYISNKCSSRRTGFAPERRCSRASWRCLPDWSGGRRIPMKCAFGRTALPPRNRSHNRARTRTRPRTRFLVLAWVSKQTTFGGSSLATPRGVQATTLQLKRSKLEDDGSNSNRFQPVLSSCVIPAYARTFEESF